MTWWRLPRLVMPAQMSSSVSWRTGFGRWRLGWRTWPANAGDMAALHRRRQWIRSASVVTARSRVPGWRGTDSGDGAFAASFLTTSRLPAFGGPLPPVNQDGYRIVIGCIPGAAGIWDGAG